MSAPRCFVEASARSYRLKRFQKALHYRARQVEAKRKAAKRRGRSVFGEHILSVGGRLLLLVADDEI